MKNRGFTLVELIGAIVILACTVLLISPIVDKMIKDSKEQALASQVDEIKNASLSWALNNVMSLPVEDNGELTITLGELKHSGLLPLNVKNPVTNELFPNDMLITIKRVDNDYDFSVDIDSGVLNSDTEYAINGPSIVLIGNYVEYSEIDYLNHNYVDKGVVARTNSGALINDNAVTKTILRNGSQVGSINTNTYNTYSIIYSVTDNGILNKITRTIIFRDTTSPVITIPLNDSILVQEVGTFNAMTGVSVVDNSGEAIVASVTGTVGNEAGKYTLTYTAIDSHGNKAFKKRIINVK